MLALYVFTTQSLHASPPNVVLIFTDDQGINDVGCYGSEIPTPHIDSLAREGLRWTQWYSASSICTPSRYGLLTGRNPCRSQDQLLGALMFLADEDKTRGLHSGEATVAQTLQAAGYRTALIGKWHLGHGHTRFLPTRHGFDSFYGHTGGCIDFFTMRYGNTLDWYRNEAHTDITGYATDVITDEAVNFLSNQEKDKPFFLFLSYNAPHFGKGWNDGEQKTVNQLQPPPNDLSRVASINDITRRKYAAKVVNLDDGIGRVLATLTNESLTSNTMVVFITDHGGDPVYGGNNAPFRGGKAQLFEGGIRVPCIMRWPGKIREGTAIDAVASSLDIAPTLCEISGAKSKRAFDGQSLASLIQGEKELTDYEAKDLYWELGKHNELGRGQWTAVRSGPWKYIADANGNEFLFNIDNDKLEKRNLLLDRKTIADNLRARARQLSESYR